MARNAARAMDFDVGGPPAHGSRGRALALALTASRVPRRLALTASRVPLTRFLQLINPPAAPTRGGAELPDARTWSGISAVSEPSRETRIA